MSSPELRIAAVSRRQHGAFSRQQAIDCGFTDSTILRRLRSGLWIRAHAGVYIDAAVHRSDEQEATAACLACGRGAVASHATAARLLAAELPRPTLPEVTVPPGTHPRPQRIRVRRARQLPAQDLARARGVPVTSAPRTLVDLAGVTEAVLLEIALDTLWRRRSVDPESLAHYLASPRHRPRPGTNTLRQLVRERLGQRPPGSELETIYIQILRSFGVPLPLRQHPVKTRSGRRVIDLAYPDHRLAIELNGFERHARDRQVFDDDHIRRNDLEALAWNIREFTRTQCLNDRAYVAITTAEAIGLVPSRWKTR